MVQTEIQTLMDKKQCAKKLYYRYFHLHMFIDIKIKSCFSFKYDVWEVSKYKYLGCNSNISTFSLVSIYTWNEQWIIVFSSIFLDNGWWFSRRKWKVSFAMIPNFK